MHFVFDLDGTICFQDNKIDRSIEEALDRLVESGHHLVFASARPVRDMLPTIPKQFHHVEMVGGNGGLTFKDGRLDATYFDHSTVLALREIIYQYELSYLADNAVDFAYVGDLSHPLYLNVNKEVGKHRPIDELEEITKFILFAPPTGLKEVIQHLPITIFEHANEQLLDITPASITKAAGLRRLGIEQFVAFGNDNNDVSMFQQAAYSVCVGEHEAGRFADVRVKRAEVSDMIVHLANQYSV